MRVLSAAEQCSLMSTSESIQQTFAQAHRFAENAVGTIPVVVLDEVARSPCISLSPYRRGIGWSWGRRQRLRVCRRVRANHAYLVRRAEIWRKPNSVSSPSVLGCGRTLTHKSPGLSLRLPSSLLHSPSPPLPPFPFPSSPFVSCRLALRNCRRIYRSRCCIRSWTRRARAHSSRRARASPSWASRTGFSTRPR